MDKYEYKLRLEEIKTLNRKGRFQEAAQVADTIDWKKVRNISTLGIISDVYKINRRFEDAREMLLLANEKSPQNRRIIYSLCDLTVKMGLVVEAVEYYKEFVQLAPNDTSKYILLYKIYEAQDISLEERIAVLKEYKKREYNEKWAYELAFLYHRVGLATECVEECDQLILWFGEGKYVTKAMELKRLYVPLSPAQQQAYDRIFGRTPEPVEEAAAPVEVEVQTEETPVVVEDVTRSDELEFQVKPMDMGQYNTLNLQAALAESVKEVMDPVEEPDPDAVPMWMQQSAPAVPDSGMRQMKPVGQKAALAEYGGEDPDYQEDVTKMIRDSADWDAQATGQLEPEVTEVAAEPKAWEEVSAGKEACAEEEAAAENEAAVMEETAADAEQQAAEANDPETAVLAAQEPETSGADNRMDGLLAQEYDGQISMALPEARAVEKQITGQMNIEDVLAEWERRKRENQEKRKQETRQWMMQQTGSLFAEFDQQTREGILGKLQREEDIDEELLTRAAKAPKAAAVPETAPAVLTEEMYDEVEELEEIEDLQAEAQPEAAASESIAQSPVRPMPANAAARAVLAAEGVMDEMAVSKQENVQSASDSILQSVEGQTKEMPAREISHRLAAADVQKMIQQAEAANAEKQAAVEEKTAAEAAVSAEAADKESTGVQNAEAQDVKAQDAEPQNAEIQVENGQGSEVQDTEEQSAESQDEEARSAEMQQANEQSAEPEEEEKQDEMAAQRVTEQRIQEHMRSMSAEEKEMFAPFIPTRGAMRQLVIALDQISLSAYTGNVIITGAPGSNMMKLAKNMIREVRATDQNFSGKMAKISGDVLNERKADSLIAKIPNGALIVEKAGKLSAEGAENLAKALNQEHTGIIVFLLDNKRAIGRLMERSKTLAACFTARFDIAALDSATLVKYGCQYAHNMEFAIDELGRLALHTRIEDMQTNDHAVTIEEVREIVDEAIESAEKKSLRHFLDILFRKRYDEDDMIILRERDFI